MSLILNPSQLPTKGVESGITSVECIKHLQYALDTIMQKEHLYNKDVLTWGVGENETNGVKAAYIVIAKNGVPYAYEEEALGNNPVNAWRKLYKKVIVTQNSRSIRVDNKIKLGNSLEMSILKLEQ